MLCGVVRMHYGFDVTIDAMDETPAIPEWIKIAVK